VLAGGGKMGRWAGGNSSRDDGKWCGLGIQQAVWWDCRLGVWDGVNRLNAMCSKAGEREEGKETWRVPAEWFG
jgi:hypothetical protein